MKAKKWPKPYGRLCDDMWKAAIVLREPRCMAQFSSHHPTGTIDRWAHKCKGGLQGAHKIGRWYRGTRWDVANGTTLCQAAHKRLTYDYLQWEDMQRIPMAAMRVIAKAGVSIKDKQRDFSAISNGIADIVTTNNWDDFRGKVGVRSIPPLTDSGAKPTF